MKKGVLVPFSLLSEKVPSNAVDLSLGLSPE